MESEKMKILNPLVTVNILSYNRKDELRHTLTKVFEQDYKNIEVIVVDNASIDGTQEMINNQFPEVRLIQLSKNIGIAGWNKGFEIAKGEYVLVLDDDSYPDVTTTFFGVVFLEQNLNYGIVTFKIINNRINEIETRSYKVENPYLFHGCGSLIRTNVIKQIGGFDPDYFLYYNEMDLTIRCYQEKIKIKYLSEREVYHQSEELETNYEKNKYHLHKTKYEQFFKGHIRFLVKHFELKYVIFYGSKWIFNRFIIASFFNYFSSFIKVILELPMVISSAFKSRQKVDKVIQHYYNNGNQALIDRDFFPNYEKIKQKIIGE